MFDGNIAALEAHDRDADAWLDSRPICASCREPIQDEHCYNTERGVMCEECAKDYARELAEEQIEDWLGDWKDSTERYVY